MFLSLFVLFFLFVVVVVLFFFSQSFTIYTKLLKYKYRTVSQNCLLAVRDKEIRSKGQMSLYWGLFI